MFRFSLEYNLNKANKWRSILFETQRTKIQSMSFIQSFQTRNNAFLTNFAMKKKSAGNVPGLKGIPVDPGFSFLHSRSRIHPGSVSVEFPEKMAEFLRNLSLTLLSVSYKYLRKTEELSAFIHNRHS